MTYRLGEYECPQCGYVPAEPAQAVKPSEPPLDYGGIKRAKLLTPPSAPAPRPAAPSKASIYGDPSAYSAGVFEGGSIAPHSLYAPDSQPARDSLWLEKQIYFWIQVGGYVLALLLLIFASAIVANMNLPGEELSPGATVAWYLFGGGVNIVLLWVVFFGDQVWAKWCCAGCTGVGLISTVIQFFAVIGGSNMIFQSGVPGGLAFGLVTICVLVSLAMQGWLLSIVWRDIQRLQGTF